MGKQKGKSRMRKGESSKRERRGRSEKEIEEIRTLSSLATIARHVMGEVVA